MYRILLKDRFLPAQAFFNVLSDDEILGAIAHLAAGAGVEKNGVLCDVPGEDLDSPPLGEVYFSIPGEEINVDYRTFVAMTHLAISSLLSNNADKIDEVNDIMIEIHNTYGELDKKILKVITDQGNLGAVRLIS